jgi:hypothetical protein
VRAGVPKGKVESFTIDDKQYSRKRKITVYTPAGYDAKASVPYRLVISFDGEDYINDMPSPVILDNLIAAGKIYPAIQVMVDNSDDRLGDLANHQKFADLIANEVLPWVQEKLSRHKEKLTRRFFSDIAPAVWHRPTLRSDIQVYSATSSRKAVHSGAATKVLRLHPSGSRINFKTHLR